MELILTSKEDLERTLRKVLQDYDKDKKSDEPPKLYSINQLAKLLGKSYNTIKKYIEVGHLTTTKNGLIPEDSINDFLGRSSEDQPETLKKG